MRSGSFRQGFSVVTAAVLGWCRGLVWSRTESGSQWAEIYRLRETVIYLKSNLDATKIELETAHSRLRIAQVEIEALSEVNARDRKRIEAETAGYARSIATTKP